jgi:starch synthase
MKGGIVYSNFVTTVSPTHAGEARDGGQGFGMEPTLRDHSAKFGGVLNGIDYGAWNPETDPYIPATYSLATMEGKQANKAALRERFSLAAGDKPIVAHIGRLDPQKGLDLVRHAIFYCIEQGAQFVLLGSSPDPSIDAYFHHLKHEFGEHPDCHLEIGFDEELAHLIYAGADLMIVPSRFEPCGLTQLIAMRYGTVPVVRSVGGLADTVFDFQYSDREPSARNGYVFHHDNHPGLESALSRAFDCFAKHPKDFQTLRQNAMRSDHSWNIPGQHYLNIYNYIREKS